MPNKTLKCDQQLAAMTRHVSFFLPDCEPSSLPDQIKVLSSYGLSAEALAEEFHRRSAQAEDLLERSAVRSRRPPTKSKSFNAPTQSGDNDTSTSASLVRRTVSLPPSSRRPLPECLSAYGVDVTADYGYFQDYDVVDEPAATMTRSGSSETAILSSSLNTLRVQ